MWDNKIYVDIALLEAFCLSSVDLSFMFVPYSLLLLFYLFGPGSVSGGTVLDEHVQVVRPGAVFERPLLLRPRHDRQPREMAQLLVRALSLAVQITYGDFCFDLGVLWHGIFGCICLRSPAIGRPSTNAPSLWTNCGR